MIKENVAMAAETRQQGLQEKAKEAIITLNKVAAIQIAEQAASELNASELVDLIEKGFKAGIMVVGDRFGKGDMFLPELVAAAETMKSSLAILEPKLREGQVTQEPLGRIVIATVKGDLHDIGKTMVSSLLIANGFEVIDLGIDVATLNIIEAARKNQADMICLSALLTTTIIAQKEVVDALKEIGHREDFKVMIGGAASSKNWAEEIGADAYGADAQEATEIAIDLLTK
ncbi:MAG: cobalamin-dependent protein [Desulfobacterales bacterium]